MIIFTCFVLLIMELLSRQNVYDAYDEQLYLKTAQVCISYANQLETEIDKIENLSFSIVGDKGIQEKLTIIKKDAKPYYFDEMSEISDTLYGYCSVMENNVIAGILSADREWIGTTIERENLEEYVETALEKKGKITIYSQNNKMGIFREIRQISGLTMKHLGILFIEVNLQELLRDIEYSYAKNNVVPDMTIFDGEECIYSSSKEVVQTLVAENARLMGDHFVISHTSSKLGWTFVLSIPYSEINQSIKQANMRATISCVLVAVLVCILSSSFVYSLMPHINYLMKKFELFGSGIMPKAEDYPSYEGRTDEFGRLHNQFDRMSQEYQRLTQESYDNMLLLKEAQFQQLQQQIRPHFLFNTLSTIVWTASENDDVETAKIADALGRILRSSFRNVDKLVTVREEIKVVRDYMYIQKLRYQERLQMEEEIDEEVMEVVIPSFTIQPIVENVIVHVVENSLETCKIRITGHVLEDEVQIVVEDNGGNLDEEILKKLEDGEICPKGNGVGLSNVNKRIQLAFSKEYGLSVSTQRQFSRVTIHLPKDDVAKGGIAFLFSKSREFLEKGF